MSQLMIETYIETQETPTSEKELDQYNEALVNLGLQHLVIKKDVSPIAPMSDLEEKVYKTLCPNHTNIKNYKYPIPLRVLEAYAKCKPFLEKQCKDEREKLVVEIWEDTDPDPIMVAKVGWRNKFIVGRWGKELQDFPTLLKRAKEKCLADSINKIEQARQYVKLYDEDKETFAMGKLMGNISSIYF